MTIVASQSKLLKFARAKGAIASAASAWLASHHFRVLTAFV